MNQQNGSTIKEAGRPTPWSLFVILALITLGVMGRVTTHEFVDWDDRFLLSDNPKFNPPTWGSVFGFILPRNLDENLYIPATQLLWGFLAAIGHTDHADASGSLLNPWIFHGANLLLHIASAGVVFAILRCFVDDAPAFFGAIVFAIHPVQVEAVAWASGMRDLLAGFFGFVALYELTQYRLSQHRIRWSLATVAAALAMLSKPSAVALPLEAMVVDIWLMRSRLRQSLVCLWPWFVLTIPIVLITRQVQPMAWPTHTPVSLRPLVALDAVAFYITKIIAPVHLVFDYGRTPKAALAHGWRLTWIIPLVLLFLLLWKGARFPKLTAGCLLALAGLVPVLGLVSFMAQDYSTVSDHYLYPSMLGVTLVAACIIEIMATRWGAAIAWAVAIAAVGSMAIQSFAMAGVWSDSASLFSYALTVNPRSSNANAGLAFSMAESGDIPNAISHFQTAEQLNPHNGMAMMGLANLLLHEGDEDGAAMQYERLMQVYQMQPNFDPKMGAAGEVVIATRLLHRKDRSGAIAALRQARRWDPQNARIDELLSRVQAQRPAKPAPKAPHIPPPLHHAAS
jgi:Flp pilus assembly protein TadD